MGRLLDRIKRVPAPAPELAPAPKPEPATFIVEGWTLARLDGPEDEPRIRDLDLGVRLGTETRWISGK